MIRKYIIEADDSINGFNEEIARLEREWGAEEIEPCEDCVSREAIKEKKVYSEERHEYIVPVAEIDWLPSVKPQRPPGKWLDKKMTIKGAHGMAYGRYVCSVCKKKFPNKSNYCPNCGAEMEGEEC